MRWLLFPFAVLYFSVVKLRNLLYDFGLLRSKSFDFPIISVGNISVGGTGKTPHIEFLIRLLKNQYQLATLSRGYKRKTSEFIIASISSSADEIGDEPKQLKQKFPQITVAVDRKRVNGTEQLLKQNKKPDVILLDDAYQHRSIKPGLSILLIDYNKPLHKDRILPVGSLRESATELKRADIIIYTKTPKDIKPIDQRIAISHLEAQPYQNVYFTYLKYGGLEPVIPEAGLPAIALDKDFMAQNYITILVSGIANPKPLYDYLEPYCRSIVKMQFGDHHNFTKRDISHIYHKVRQVGANNKIIITTEKDAIRFQNFAKRTTLPPEILQCFYYIPIEIEFVDKDKIQFENQIIEYVRETTKNSRLQKKSNR